MRKIREMLGMHNHDWTEWEYKTNKRNMIGWIDHNGNHYERTYTEIRDVRVRTCKECKYVDEKLVQYRETERS